MHRQRHSQGIEARGSINFKQLNYPLSFQSKEKSQSSRNDLDTMNSKLNILIDTFSKISVNLENGLALQNIKTNQFYNKITETMVDKMQQMISINKTMCEGITELVKVSTKKAFDQPIYHQQTATKPNQIIQQQIIQQKNKIPSNNQNQSNRQQKDNPLQQFSGSQKVNKLITLNLAKHFSSIQEQKQYIFDQITQTYAKAQNGQKHVNQYFGKFYSLSAQRYFEQYKSNKISYQDMKIKFSYDLISQLVDLTRKWNSVYYQTQNLHIQFQKQMQTKVNYVQHLNKALKNTLKYLICKYPPSRNKIVDTSLSDKIKSTRQFSAVEFDMLKNAEMKLGLVDGQTNFNKDIKVWINMLIKQTNAQFPKFKQTMKKIFLGRQSSIEGEDMDDVEYLIGRKIVEGTSLYSKDELEFQGLQIKNSQILRILMKWCEELQSYFTDCETKVFNNKYGLKNKSLNVPIRLPRSRLQILAQNLKESYDKIMSEVGDCEKTWMGVLFVDTMNLGSQGIQQGYQFLNQKQITVLKISDYLNQSLKSFAVSYLNYYLTQLTKIRKKYQSDKLESNLNLVTFGIMDLLRCKCVASKSQINRVYEQITQNTDYFQVIRVKNKLNESTRDILINLKLKKSFLICQVQLSLGSQKQQANNNFCHYLYELQRSQFSVIYQCASQISNIDPRMSYIKKQKHLKLKGNSVVKQSIRKNTRIVRDQIHCQIGHSSVPMDIIKNQQPFVCLICSSYVKSYNTCLYFAHCMTCHNSICSLCIIQFYNTQSVEFMMKYISRFVQCQHSVMFFKHFIDQGVVRPSSMKKAVQKHIKDNTYIMQMIVNERGHIPIIYKKYKKEIIPAFSTFNQISVPNVSNEPCWNFIEETKPYCIKKITDLDDYVKYHMALQWSDLQSILKEKGQQEVVCVIVEEHKSALIIDVVETEQDIQQFRINNQLQNKINQINLGNKIDVEFTSKQIQSIDWLKRIEQKGEIKNINFWQNQLQDIGVLSQFNNLVSIILRQNKIKSIAPIINLRNIQYLLLSQNQISGELPVIKLQKLKVLDVHNNKITNIQNLEESQLSMLIVLRIGYLINITSIPKIDAPKLNVLYFQGNQVSNINTISQSNLKSIKKIVGSKNRINEIPSLNFQTLKQLYLSYNKIQSLEQFAKSKCNKLKTIHLNNNQIEGALSSFQNFKSLKYLLLTNNKIDSFRDKIFHLNSLLKLDISNNNLIGQLCSFQCCNLKELNLSNNKLKCISNLSHSILPLLTILDLSHNEILGKIPSLYLIKLEQLNFSYNVIENADEMSKWKLPQVTNINLSQNKIQGKIPKMYLQKLKVLNIAGNNIQEWEFVNHLHLVRNLEKVILNGNQVIKNKYDKNFSHLFIFQKQIVE